MTDIEKVVADATSSARLVDVIDRLTRGDEVFFHFIRTVADIMGSAENSYLTLDDRLSDGLLFFQEKAVNAIPIVERVEPARGSDEPTREVLIGVVSQPELARMISVTVGTLSQNEADDKVLRQPLGSVVQRTYQYTSPDSTLFSAVQTMLDHQVDTLPVVIEDGKDRLLVGTLTTRDVVRCFVRMNALKKARTTSEPKKVRLVDLMRGGGGGGSQQVSELLFSQLMGTVADMIKDDAPKLTVEHSIKDAISVMRKLRLRALPVASVTGKLAGIITDIQILRYLPPPADRRRPQAAALKTRDAQAGGLADVDPEDKEIQRALRERVSAVMSNVTDTLTPSTSAVKVAELFVEGDARALAVVDGEPPVVKGLVCAEDFLGALLAIARLVMGGQAV